MLRVSRLWSPERQWIYIGQKGRGILLEVVTDIL